MAYDADSGDGTVYEYNFSRQNEGGCVMFCLEEAIHSRFCNNVSFDDLSGTISPAQNPDALLSHNRYYVRKGIPFVRKNMVERIRRKRMKLFCWRRKNDEGADRKSDDSDKSGHRAGNDRIDETMGRRCDPGL